MHFLLAWYVWPPHEKSGKYPHAPVVVRTSMAWRLTGDGYTPLTNGLVLLHVAMAFVPWLNTTLVYFEWMLGLLFGLLHLFDSALGAVKRWMGAPTSLRKKTYTTERIDPHF